MKEMTDKIFDGLLPLTIVVCFLSTIALMAGSVLQFFSDGEIRLAIIYSSGLSGAYGGGLSLFFIKVKRMAGGGDADE